MSPDGLVDKAYVDFIPRAELDAIAHGDHANPFGVLGMHERDGRVVVRTFQPSASRVWVVDARDGKPVAELARVHGQGLFAGPMPRKERFPYRLRLAAGEQGWEIEDP